MVVASAISDLPLIHPEVQNGTCFDASSPLGRFLVRSRAALHLEIIAIRQLTLKREATKPAAPSVLQQQARRRLPHALPHGPAAPGARDQNPGGHVSSVGPVVPRPRRARLP